MQHKIRDISSIIVNVRIIKSMKVIKRDGRIVDYDEKKIALAIEKANDEVRATQRIPTKEIQSIIDYIESLDKKRILVEDIQDIIEVKLMELGYYALAKKYIVYRHNRTLVRKKNTTDESILGLIKSGSGSGLQQVAKVIRNQQALIAKEISKDLSLRVLLPEKITSAHNEGKIYFHDMNYFLQPMIYQSWIDTKTLLTKGCKIHDTVLDAPATFLQACSLLAQCVIVISDCQISTVGFSLKHLVGFSEKLHCTSDQIMEGTNLLVQLINTVINPCFKEKKVLLYLEGDLNPLYRQLDDCVKDSKILLVEKEKRLKNTVTIEETVNAYYPLWHDREGNSVDQGRFSQGVVSLNCVGLALHCEGVEKEFYKLLQNTLDLCFESLLRKHYALMSTKTESAPLMFHEGALASLELDQTIDSLLKKDDCPLVLSVVGLEEASKVLSVDQSKILKKVVDSCMIQRIETGLGFIVRKNSDIELSKFLRNIDMKKFGVIESITDHDYQIN